MAKKTTTIERKASIVINGKTEALVIKKIVTDEKEAWEKHTERSVKYAVNNGPFVAGIVNAIKAVFPGMKFEDTNTFKYI